MCVHDSRKHRGGSRKPSKKLADMTGVEPMSKLIELSGSILAGQGPRSHRDRREKLIRILRLKYGVLEQQRDRPRRPRAPAEAGCTCPANGRENWPQR